MDIKAATKRGIWVCNLIEVNSLPPLQDGGGENEIELTYFVFYGSGSSFQKWF